MFTCEWLLHCERHLSTVPSGGRELVGHAHVHSRPAMNTKHREAHFTYFAQRLCLFFLLNEWITFHYEANNYIKMNPSWLIMCL